MSLSAQFAPIEIYRNTIFKRLIFSVWIILGYYSFYYGFMEGAEFLAWTVLSGFLFFLPMTLGLEYRGHKTAARILFLFSINAFIYLTSLGLSHKTGSQYYFLPVAMIPFVLFDNSQRRLIFASTAFTFAVWSLIHILGPIPKVSAMVTSSFDFATIKITDFIGAFGVTVVSLLIFLKTNRQLTDLLESNAQKKVEEERHQSQQLRAAQKIASMASWQFNEKSGFELWNNESFENFGILDPESQKNFWKVFTENLEQNLKSKKNEGFLQEKLEYLGKNGQQKWLEILGQMTYNHSGALEKAIGTCRDITQKVNSELIVERQRLQLVQASKLASLGEMSAGVAHEINNPLAIILGNLPLLHKFKDQDEKFVSKVEAIKKAAVRIEKIVKGLKKFSRTSEGNIFKVEPLKEIVLESITLTEAKSKQSSVKVKAEISEDLKINCDSLEIEQVLVNLINNGVDAIKNKSEKWIQINGFLQGNEVILQVVDSGNGIASEVEQKLFQPFFTTKAAGEGTGLGLSITKGILDQHNATLALNRSFKNTCFEIRFPLPQAKDSASKKTA